MYINHFLLFPIQEVVGVGYNRLIRMNPKSAEVTKTYRFSTMSSWSVHWENREVIVDFEEEKLAIKPLSADCKVFHEFLGKSNLKDDKFIHLLGNQTCLNISIFSTNT